MAAVPVAGHLRLRCKVTVPKDHRTANEDYYQVSERLGVYALCDGASVSYDSASWARTLSRHFCQDQSLDRRWLLGCIGEFNGKYDRDALPWAQQGAFDRGSFSSLLGVVMCPDSGSVLLWAIGDTTAFLAEQGQLRSSFPYKEAGEYDNRPTLLSTICTANEWKPDGSLTCRQTRWRIDELTSPELFCMTDALARWVLDATASDPGVLRLLRNRCEGQRFTELVYEERRSGRLRKDDTTLLAFW